jgi:hypothetical protein
MTETETETDVSKKIVCRKNRKCGSLNTYISYSFVITLNNSFKLKKTFDNTKVKVTKIKKTGYLL